MSSEPPTHGDEALQDSAGRERGDEPANLEAVASGALTPGSVLASILDRLPPDERHYLRLGPDASAVSATRILDDDWFDEQIRLRGLIWGIEDRFTLGTLWWYSASNWIVLPTVASMFLTDRVLSPRLEDVALHWRPDSRIPGATSSALLEGSGIDELGATLDAVIGVLASRLSREPQDPAGRVHGSAHAPAADLASREPAHAPVANPACGEPTHAPAADLAGRESAHVPVANPPSGQHRREERRLWSMAVDSLANRLLWLGTVTGEQERAQQVARDLVAALGRPGVPAPRFTTLTDLPEGARDVWVRRGSCCLLYHVPGHANCADCPRLRPSERETRLRDRALHGDH